MTYEAVDAETGESLNDETAAKLYENNVLWNEEGWGRVGDRVVFDIDAAELVIGTSVCFVVEAQGPTFNGGDERCVVITDLRP